MSQLIDTKGASICAAEAIHPLKHGALRLGDDISFALGRLHEAHGDAADMLPILAASQFSGPVFWIGPVRAVKALTPTALQTYLDPARIVLTMGVSRDEVLWAAEQVLQTCGNACVVMETSRGPDLRESRRLQIAAEASGAIGFALFQGRAQSSAAETRWHCEAAGDNQWVWTCTKNKRGVCGAWRVNWQGEEDAPGVIHMAAATAA